MSNIDNSKYMDFLKSKMAIAKETGFEIDPSDLNPDYFRDGVGYCKAEEDEIDAPTLFDYLEVAE